MEARGKAVNKAGYCCIAIALFWFIAPHRTLYAQGLSQQLVFNCPDQNWYPFLFVEGDDQPRGILIDIVQKALSNLNIEVAIHPVPLKRAIVNSQRGKSDGIIGIGYRAELDKELAYPPGAAGALESNWRILQIDHVVVTAAGDPYVFDGRIETLPEPVRLIYGSPILGELQEAGVKPQELRGDKQNLMQLLRDNNGVAITTSVVAEMMAKQPEFNGMFNIQATVLASHSYHLAFTRQSAIPDNLKPEIWQEIQRVRDDFIFILQVFSQY